MEKEVLKKIALTYTPEAIFNEIEKGNLELENLKTTGFLNMISEK